MDNKIEKDPESFFAVPLIDEDALNNAIEAAGTSIGGQGLADTPLTNFTRDQFAEVIDQGCKAYFAEIVGKLYLIYGASEEGEA